VQIPIRGLLVIWTRERSSAKGKGFGVQFFCVVSAGTLDEIWGNPIQKEKVIE